MTMARSLASWATSRGSPKAQKKGRPRPAQQADQAWAWRLLCQLPARVLRKVRHIVDRDGLTVAVDRFEDGSLLAEMDDGGQPPRDVPAWLAVQQEVTTDERWTGARLADVAPLGS